MKVTASMGVDLGLMLALIALAFVVYGIGEEFSRIFVIGEWG